MALEDKKPQNQGIALVGLILNILVLPGLGSIIGGRQKTGVWQLALILVSIPLLFVLVGFLTGLAAWIWGIVTGVQMVQEAPNK